MTSSTRSALLAFGILLFGCGGHTPPAPEIPPAPLPPPERRCGGLSPEGAGGGCAQNEFCDYAPEASCGAADATGICRTKPVACTRELHPVCGCDAQTYPTRCVANAAGVSVAHEGECVPPPPPVPEGVGTTCGTRGVPPCPEGLFCDYPREAQCGAADAPGTCQVKPEACTLELAQVCGCDAATYANACAAHAAGVSVASEGECAPPPPPSRRRTPPSRRH